MNYTMSVEQIKEAVRDRLAHTFAVSLENATDEEYYKASALIVRELLAKGRSEFVQNAEKTGTKQIYYLCMEFLLGRSLRNNLCNLGLEENFRKALADYGIKLDNLYEQEPDAGLGNGGLGRLAACFMDGLATQGYPAMGYSLRYEYGLFRQKLVDGWQTELPDTWLPGGGIWLQQVPKAPWKSALAAISRSSGTTSTTPCGTRTTPPSPPSPMTCASPAWTARASAYCGCGRRKTTSST